MRGVKKKEKAVQILEDEIFFSRFIHSNEMALVPDENIRMPCRESGVWLYLV